MSAMPDPVRSLYVGYFVLPGGVTRGVTKEEPAGDGTFLGCFGFFASRLPRCWPFGIWISLAFARTVGHDGFFTECQLRGGTQL